MAFSQSDIDKIKAAIAGGVRSVTFADGRRVDYQSVAEMVQALAMAQAEVNGTSNGGSMSTTASFTRD